MRRLFATVSVLALTAACFPQVEAASAFRDVSGTPYESAFSYLQGKGLVRGYSDGSGHPTTPISRVDALKVALDLHPYFHDRVQWFSTHLPPIALYDDVDQNAWYAPYIETAFEAGLITGFSDHTFRPTSSIRAEEAMALLLKSYGDVPAQRVSDARWYLPAVTLAFQRNLISPREKLHLGDPLTRGQFFDMAYRTDVIHTQNLTAFAEPLVASSSSAISAPVAPNPIAVVPPAPVILPKISSSSSSSKPTSAPVVMQPIPQTPAPVTQPKTPPTPVSPPKPPTPAPQPVPPSSPIAVVSPAPVTLPKISSSSSSSKPTSAPVVMQPIPPTPPAQQPVPPSSPIAVVPPAPVTLPKISPSSSSSSSKPTPTPQPKSSSSSSKSSSSSTKLITQTPPATPKPPAASSSSKTSPQPPSSVAVSVSQKNFAVTIPALGIDDLTISHPADPTTSKGLLSVLTEGVGHLFSYPGSNGKVMIYGHSSGYPWDISKYTKIFRTVNKLKAGDRVYVSFRGALHVYEVTFKEAVPAGDMKAFSGEGEELILFTCWPPDSIKQRYLVHAMPVNNVATR